MELAHSTGWAVDWIVEWRGPKAAAVVVVAVVASLLGSWPRPALQLRQAIAGMISGYLWTAGGGRQTATMQRESGVRVSVKSSSSSVLV